MALHIHTIFLVISSLLPSPFLYCAARDTITTGSSFSDINGDALISAGGRFQLGFFSPPKIPRYGRYIGIWYNNMDPQTVVWTANSDNPLSDPTGVFVIGEDGNLVVLDESKNVKFTTNLGASRGSNRTVKLLDSGNLVLSDHDQSGDTTLWQSFEHPTDTFLPGMKMDENLKLTSWTSEDDPRSGNFAFQQDSEGGNRFIIFSNGTITYWRNEDTGNFISSPDMFPAADFLLSNFSSTADLSYQNKNDQTGNISYTKGKLVPARDFNYTRLKMNASGEIQFFSWSNERREWSLIWSEPRDNCSRFNACGNFGICNSKSVPLCKCLPAYEQSSPDNWLSGDFSSGCTRKSTKCSKNSTFSNFKLMKVGKPNLPFQVAESEKVCIDNCQANCNCKAYSYIGVYIAQKSRTLERNSTWGCLFWTSDLYSLWEDPNGGHNIYVRNFSFATEAGEPKPAEVSQNRRTSTSHKTVLIFTIVIALVLLISGISYISYKRMVTIRQGSRASNQGNAELRLYDTERRIKDLIDSGHFEEDDKKGIDVPFFDLESILAATNNFSLTNKLGQGGFGPVYKGKFPGGQEIAVKRLSSHSGQGLEEFKNEVVLIAKLQHRNLVRILGYCVKGDEKILLYEYMPNKSLDAFLFDRTACLLLNWEKRFDIILGVARGLLYLHEDSRLRIIHRDMKTSNILLDEEMNPKISDFGLARIVGGKETEANTNKVVGTYGYMSPEYALDGLFSIKSDVFSFGVVVLEIVSGKRNTGFYRSPQALNLLGYAWRLWKEEKALDLMDQVLLESCNRSEVLKCIIIGLLCVQEDPGDRPTMSTVVFMLGSEIATLPNPKQPAFVTRKSPSTTPSSSSSKQETHLNNELTDILEYGR